MKRELNMNHFHRSLSFKGLLALIALAIVWVPRAEANWTLNLGYHNPLNSKLGINFLYWGSQWNFEIGLGWLDADASKDDETNSETKDDDKVSFAAAGDLDVKYRFSTGNVAPYIQLGFGAGTGAQVGDKSDAGVGFGGPFVGLGLFFGKPALYAYVAGNYLIESKDNEFQGGLGFDI